MKYTKKVAKTVVYALKWAWQLPYQISKTDIIQTADSLKYFKGFLRWKLSKCHLIVSLNA